jgi:MFS family permease
MTLLVEPSELTETDATTRTGTKARPDQLHSLPQRRPTRLRTAGPLTLVLLIQGLLSVRQTPFASTREALTLYIGHLDLLRLAASTAGTPPPTHSMAVTGYLYPLVAGLADHVGGLGGARLVSLAFMMGATLLVCGTARRLFGELAGVVAACLFVAASPTLFFGNVAQYDAMGIFCLCLAARLAVTSLTRTDWRAVLSPALAGSAAALCAFTGPAGLLFAPLIGVLVIVATAWPPEPSAGYVTRLTSFLAGAGISVGILVGLLPFLEPGVRTYFTRWRPDTVYGSAASTLGTTFWFVGAAVILALAAFCLALKSRSSVRTMAVVGVLLFGSLGGLLYGLVLHRGPSLIELDGFALVFAAILGGEAARQAFTHWRGKAVIPVIAVVLGMLTFAGATFGMNYSWKSESHLVARLAPEVRPAGGTYLVFQPTVPQYYLDGQSLPTQFVATTGFEYSDPSTGRVLSGRHAYRAAIDAGYFALVALPSPTPRQSMSSFLRGAVTASGRYELRTVVPATASQRGWDIWTLMALPPGTTDGRPAK